MEIPATDRQCLRTLFEDCPYDRVLIDSVLEGHFGRAYAAPATGPEVARLDSGAFTILGGDPDAAGAKDLLHLASIDFVTPQSAAWRRFLLDEFGAGVKILRFVEFSSHALDRSHLHGIIRGLAPDFMLERVDRALAERLSPDTGNEYFLENFHSIDDFLARGIGYCIVHRDMIVSAATSMVRRRGAIDVEIETVPDYRGRGLAAVVGARLVAHCLELEIKPHWLAANTASERLALKLGYVRGGSYETLEIEAGEQLPAS